MGTGGPSRPQLRTLIDAGPERNALDTHGPKGDDDGGGARVLLAVCRPSHNPMRAQCSRRSVGGLFLCNYRVYRVYPTERKPAGSSGYFRPAQH